MPDLLHTLMNHDLEMLKIIAGKWDLSLEKIKQPEVAKEIASGILAHREKAWIVDSWPSDARECFSVLSGMGGKLLWSEFLRRYGTIREMGIARRNREEPYEAPASVAEWLWYQGLIGRAFLKVGDDLQEYAYIPDELLNLIPKVQITPANQSVMSVDQDTLHLVHPANDRILDHLTSYLAARRSGRNPQDLISEFKQPSMAECEQLLLSTDLLDASGDLHPDAVKAFLAKPRGEALSHLFTKWLRSSSFNELKLMPGIISEGLWKNDPLKTRKVLIERILGLDGKTWWGIDSYVAQIKRTVPDFQRPAGDYESWMIRSKKTGDSLRGFEHWDQVDGALIRYMIRGPLHWLGFLDLGGVRSGAPPEVFRLSRLADYLYNNKPPQELAVESGHITALRNGKLTCPRDAPRAVRYQLARFCERSGLNDKGYLYQITSGSLGQAINQGLLIEQLIILLTRHTGGAMPASLVTALQRWARNGAQTSLKQIVILSVASPEILVEIRNSPIGRFLGEPLNPTTAILPSTAVAKIVPRLMELGYFCEQDEGTLLVKSDRE